MRILQHFTHYTVSLIMFNVLGLSLVFASTAKISEPGKYSGYSNIIYESWNRSSEYVTVSDGTKLAMDIFRPMHEGKLVSTPLPVIFIFTPYGRGMNILNKENIPVTGPKGNALTLYTPSGSYALHGGLVKLIKSGYVIACADVRGLGASYGSRAAGNDRVEARDAHDLIEWLGARHYSDGNVAMWGASYFGQTVLEAISTKPSHLKAAYFGVTNFNSYDAWARGGITRGSAGEVEPDPEKEVKSAVPVDGDIDNDGDGYPDQLWEAVNEHVNNGKFTQLLQSLPYRNSLSEHYENGSSSYWEDTSGSNYLEQIKQGGVPAYVFGAWYDFLRRDTVMTFANWPNPVKMVLTQGVHGDSITGLPNQLNQLSEIHRFFDFWLKGVENGVMEEPPVYYSTITTPKSKKNRPDKFMPNVVSWNFASQWPPHNLHNVELFLDNDSTESTSINKDAHLRTKAPDSEIGKDIYQVDYTITTDLEPVVGASIPSGKEFDEKGLTYTTDPLSKDMKVNGLPVMNLWAASDNRDADFIVILEDVDADGNSFYVSDGRLRASLRKVNQPPYNFLGLPWHRSYAEDESMLIPEDPVKLEITMMPTSYKFKKGHRIRLSIVASLGKVFNLDKEKNENAPQYISVYRNKTKPSNISLPTSKNSNTFSGNLMVDSEELKFSGKGKLYIGSKVLYLGFNNEWIQCKSVLYKKQRLNEKYICQSKLGKLSATTKNTISGEIITLEGPGVNFKGIAKP